MLGMTLITQITLAAGNWNLKVKYLSQRSEILRNESAGPTLPISNSFSRWNILKRHAFSLATNIPDHLVAGIRDCGRNICRSDLKFSETEAQGLLYIFPFHFPGGTK